VKPASYFNLKDFWRLVVEGASGGPTPGRPSSSSTGNDIAIYDASPKGKDSKQVVLTAGRWRPVPKQGGSDLQRGLAEYRDYFYVPNMHGYDWMTLRRQYGQLLEFVAHRSDLNYVMGEMAPSSTSGIHRRRRLEPSAREGRCRAAGRARESAGRYRISKICGQNEEESTARLTRIGVDAARRRLPPRDRRRTSTSRNYGSLQQQGRPARRARAQREADPAGARKVVFQPIASESTRSTSTGSREPSASTSSGGKIAYMHPPTMGAEGSASS
jgi:tricorn protease